MGLLRYGDAWLSSTTPDPPLPLPLLCLPIFPMLLPPPSHLMVLVCLVAVFPTQLFAELDKEGTGVLSMADFVDALLSLNTTPALSKEEAILAAHHIDADRSGTIDYNEFAGAFEVRGLLLCLSVFLVMPWRNHCCCSPHSMNCRLMLKVAGNSQRCSR